MLLEINNEFRSSDYERWQGQGFVLGVEIYRSKSAKEACGICDNMKGRYPKMFKFQGWCDGCKCFWVPIMLEGEEFIDFLLTGEVPKDKIVKNIPEKALEYIQNHKDELKEYYWVDELLKLNSK